jgi:hypothetical protein
MQGRRYKYLYPGAGQKVQIPIPRCRAEGINANPGAGQKVQIPIQVQGRR